MLIFLPAVPPTAASSQSCHSLRRAPPAIMWGLGSMHGLFMRILLQKLISNTSSIFILSLLKQPFFRAGQLYKSESTSRETSEGLEAPVASWRDNFAWLEAAPVEHGPHWLYIEGVSPGQDLLSVPGDFYKILANLTQRSQTLHRQAIWMLPSSSTLRRPILYNSLN